MSLSALAVGFARPSDAHLRDGERGAREAPSTSCVEDDVRTVTDFTSAGGSATPGLLAVAAREGDYASTAVVRFADERARERALGALQRAAEQQRGAPGLVGVALATSEKCGSMRLLSVWRDEPSMLAWVTSSALLDALHMAESEDGSAAMISWKMAASDVPMGWEAARKHLAGVSPLY